MTSLPPRLLGTYATTVGKAHIKSGLPNQDAAGIVKIGSRGIAVAVADGAGSADHAETGSRTAVDTLLNHFKENHRLILENHDLSSTIEVVRSKLSETALALACDTKQLATTLLGVLAIRQRTEVIWLALHVGDGMIVGDSGNGPQVISPPENGEFGNTTFFVTDTSIGSHLRLYRGVAKSIKFALLTDGACESLYHRSSGTLAGAFSTLFSWADQVDARRFKKALKQNLDNFIAKKTTDDATIAIASIRTAETGLVLTPRP